MNTLSLKKSKDNHLIKSWFGFFFGASLFGISLIALFESFSLGGILRSFAFFIFWILWSQMIGLGWNLPITKLFVKKVKTTKTSSLSFYLPFIPLILLAISFII
ncbi:hypothetical protein [Acinetobacter sp. 1125_18A]|uniref:hypothetical protein n=1 Tax=Acinetobacter sp. 1125_18A TaxID=2605959 RepID=UPI00405A1B63